LYSKPQPSHFSRSGNGAPQFGHALACSDTSCLHVRHGFIFSLCSHVASRCLARLPPALSLALAHWTRTPGRNASVTGQLQRLVSRVLYVSSCHRHSYAYPTLARLVWVFLRRESLYHHQRTLDICSQNRSPNFTARVPNRTMKARHAAIIFLVVGSRE
jgi:hypothetical protein